LTIALLVTFIVVVFNAFAFRDMQTWAGPISILIIELVGLLALAKSCGVDDVEKLVDKILEAKPFGRRDND